jgi:hypothetical protein
VIFMDDATYQKMMDMAMGRVPRDQAWLDQQARLGHIQEELEAKARAAKEQPVLSHREMELAQREFDLKMFGKTAMEKFAKPLDGVDKLSVPGDLRGHSGADQRPVPPKHLKLQFHGVEPGCKMWKV